MMIVAIMTTANNNINTDSFNTIHYNNNNTTTLLTNQNHDQIRLIKSTTTSLNGQSIDCKFWFFLVFVLFRHQQYISVLFLFLHNHTH